MHPLINMYWLFRRLPLHVAIDVQATGSSSKFYMIHLTLFRPAVPNAYVHYFHARPFRH